MTSKLSRHFALEELTHSQTAARNGLDNTPSAQVKANLVHTAKGLEKIRALLGSRPLLISSGYRSPAVNALVGGSENSAHMTGYAVDFICPGFGSPLGICKLLASQASFQFDQIIQEGTWVHISFDPRSRRQLLTKSGSGFTPGIRKAT
jgi:hypothetical protein